MRPATILADVAVAVHPDDERYTSLIGKEYPPYAVTVERGKIKEFARALGDANPLYLDDRVGAASEWGDLIAPPTFSVTFRDETADTAAFLRTRPDIAHPARRAGFEDLRRTARPDLCNAGRTTRSWPLRHITIVRL